jgi:hypothetical protein
MNRAYKTIKMTIIILVLIVLTVSSGFAQYNNTIEASEIIKDLGRNKKIDIKNSVIVGDLYFIDAVKPEVVKGEDNEPTYVSTIKSSIRFSDCLFKGNLSTTGIFEDEYTIMKNSFTLENCVIEGNANFSYTTFKDEVFVLFTEFKKEAYFEQVEFESIVDFWDTTVKGKEIAYDIVDSLSSIEIMNKIKQGKDLEASNAVVYGDIDLTSIQLSNNQVKSKISFDNVIFRGSIIAGGKNGYTFQKGITMEECLFDKDVDFSNSHFMDKVSFRKSQFNSLLIIDGALFEEEAFFDDTMFTKKQVNLASATFIRGYSFNKSYMRKHSTVRRTETSSEEAKEGLSIDEFYDILKNENEGIIEDLIVKDDIFFLEFFEKYNDKTIVEKPLKFRKVRFLGEVVFSSKSEYIQFKSILIFEKCVFEKGVDFSEVVFEDIASFVGSVFMGEVKFEDASFESKAIFDNTEFNGEIPPDFTGVSFNGEVSFEGSTYLGEPYKPTF